MNGSRQTNYFPERNTWLSAPVSVFFKYCKVENYQDSGKGGQKRNRKYSAVRLTHIPSEISVTCANCREQNINKINAMKKLKLKISLLLSGPDIKITRNIISMESPDYPLWVAYILDELYKNSFEIPPISKALKLSKSKLIKLIYKDRTIWNELNSNRIKLGKTPFIPPC